jgi:hypothetical protein
MFEALKYIIEIVTNLDGQGKRQKAKRVKPNIYKAANNNIYAAMQGLRIF